MFRLSLTLITAALAHVSHAVDNEVENRSTVQSSIPDYCASYTPPFKTFLTSLSALL